MKKTIFTIIGLVLGSSAISENLDGEYYPSQNNSATVIENLHPIEEEVQRSIEKGIGGNSYYYFVAASGASPRESGITYSYTGAGCINGEGNGTSVYMDQNIPLPDGHTITYMRFYYNDSTNSDTVAAHLFLMPGDGTNSLLETRTSDSDSGYSSVGSPMNHVVQNINGALVLRFEGVDNPSIEACGVRLVVQNS